MERARLPHDEVKQIQAGCHALIPGYNPAYGYVPSLAAGIVFCILFGLSMSGHLFQSIRKKRWTSYVLTVGAASKFLQRLRWQS